MQCNLVGITYEENEHSKQCKKQFLSPVRINFSCFGSYHVNHDIFLLIPYVEPLELLIILTLNFGNYNLHLCLWDVRLAFPHLFHRILWNSAEPHEDKFECEFRSLTHFKRENKKVLC